MTIKVVAALSIIDYTVVRVSLTEVDRSQLTLLQSTKQLFDMVIENRNNRCSLDFILIGLNMVNI